MKHNTLWRMSIMAVPVALGLLGGCGGTSLGSRTETIMVADDLFRSTGTDNRHGFFDGFLYQAPEASRQAGEIRYAPKRQSIPPGAKRVDGGQVTLTVTGGAGSRANRVTQTSKVGYFAVLGLPVGATVTLSVSWNQQTFGVDVSGFTSQPYKLHGSFGLAGPIDPPDFGNTGPLDIVITAAKARYTIQNLGDTPASGKLYISEKTPDQINANNVEAQAVLSATMPPEGAIPAGEVVHFEGQDIFNPTLKQFLEHDQTFYFYALATSQEGTVNVRVTNLQITVRAEVQL